MFSCVLQVRGSTFHPLYQLEVGTHRSAAADGACEGCLSHIEDGLRDDSFLNGFSDHSHVDQDSFALLHGLRLTRRVVSSRLSPLWWTEPPWTPRADTGTAQHLPGGFADASLAWMLHSSRQLSEELLIFDVTFQTQLIKSHHPLHRIGGAQAFLTKAAQALYFPSELGMLISRSTLVKSCPFSRDRFCRRRGHPADWVKAHSKLISSSLKRGSIESSHRESQDSQVNMLIRHAHRSYSSGDCL